MSDIGQDGRWVEIGDASSLGPGELRQADVDGVLVIIVATDEGIAAFQGLCSHESYPMADGYLEGGTLVCSLHGSAFDLVTGGAALGPADLPLARYTVEVKHGRIWLLVPPGGLLVNE